MRINLSALDNHAELNRRPSGSPRREEPRARDPKPTGRINPPRRPIAAPRRGGY
ncbi:hypothetical protein GCM10022248_73110 [Nonomuraea soli]